MATADLSTSPRLPAAIGSLELTPQEETHLLTAAAELVRAAAAGQAANLPDATLGGLADRLVAGVFVSLKRAGQLRGCCGMLGQPVRLAKALGDAAERTVWEDARFPPVSPRELEHLEMEVWLLGAPERMRARGEDRQAAVHVGRHGLVIERERARGLLLPGVPLDHGWDAHRFLEQVCTKAGLHPTLWKDDGSTLFTFEGQSVRGRVSAPRPEGTPRSPVWFTAQELGAYVGFCRDNVYAILAGATPTYYLSSAPDGTLNGIVLTVLQAGQVGGHTFSQISTRPGVPLQSSLFALCQAAAQRLAQQGIGSQDVGSLQLELALLYDPTMHGTVSRPHMDGIEPPYRGVLVLERTRAGLVFDPKTAPEQLVAQAAEQAGVRQAATAAVFSLETQTTGPRLTVAIGPQPVRGPAVRPPGVAGRFYPADPTDLATLVSRLLQEPSDSSPEEPQPWSAALLPHAGLSYSGRLAAAVLKRIRIPRTVIVLGPKHTPHGVEWAVAPQQTWAMPGFTVESDPNLARQLTQAIPGLELDALAHREEHAIEVELPFLSRLAPECRVVGLALGGGDLESCLGFAERLAAFLGSREERPLLLISSDMNHFATDDENRRLDAIALAALERLDPRALYESLTENHISMCGLVPAVIVLETLRRLGGLRSAQRVGYATSADVSGDRSRVVGYAGMLFRS